MSFKNFPEAFKKQLYCRTALDGYYLTWPQQPLCIYCTLASNFELICEGFEGENSLLAGSRKFIFASFYTNSKIVSVRPKSLKLGTHTKKWLIWLFAKLNSRENSFLVYLRELMLRKRNNFAIFWFREEFWLWKFLILKKFRNFSSCSFKITQCCSFK